MIRLTVRNGVAYSAGSRIMSDIEVRGRNQRQKSEEGRRNQTPKRSEEGRSEDFTLCDAVAVTF
jgi:hypothetical protein